MLVEKDNLTEVWKVKHLPLSEFSNWSLVFTVLVTKIRDWKQWSGLVVLRIWFVSSKLQHVHWSWGIMVPVKVASLAEKNPFRRFFFSSWFVHPKQLWILVCKKEVKAISTLVFRRESKLLGYIAQRYQGNPQSREFALGNVRLSVGRNLVSSGQLSENVPHTDFQKITGRFSVV